MVVMLLYESLFTGTYESYINDNCSRLQPTSTNKISNKEIVRPTMLLLLITKAIMEQTRRERVTKEKRGWRVSVKSPTFRQVTQETRGEETLARMELKKCTSLVVK
ncbi:hypothetical protein Bca101_002159 [Brassica carinata]